MGRIEKEGCDFFFTSTRLLYDTKVKALRRSFKDTNNANNAFFVFDYLFREIFANEGYYIEYTDDLVGDTSDFCYLPTSFVREVIEKCCEIGLFHSGQFEKNSILTSRAIQRKYEKITERRKRSAIESRFCVLGEELMSTETELMSTSIELMSTDGTQRRERERERERVEEASISQKPPGIESLDSRVRGLLDQYVQSKANLRKKFDPIQVGLFIQKILPYDIEEQLQILQENIEADWKSFIVTDKVKDINLAKIKEKERKQRAENAKRMAMEDNRQ